tara:strand:+ start:672 stop:1355 length:684 start_codon:yes stop_codon:yes gene_type:complete
MSKKIIVALDSSNMNKTIKLVKSLNNEAYAFKIGYEFFFNFGIHGYNKIKKITPNIFLDLKLHDIPNTVGKGIKAISNLSPLLTTIHISGGDEMMKYSLLNKKNTKILGVSILTSLNSLQTRKYYNDKSIRKLVRKFVKYANIQGLDGIVCSPKEIKYIREEVSNNFLIVTPGIRLLNSKIGKDDQKRVLSPSKAIKMGANLLVIGRPITEAKNPLLTLKNINKSLI